MSTGGCRCHFLGCTSSHPGLSDGIPFYRILALLGWVFAKYKLSLFQLSENIVLAELLPTCTEDHQPSSSEHYCGLFLSVSVECHPPSAIPGNTLTWLEVNS